MDENMTNSTYVPSNCTNFCRGKNQSEGDHEAMKTYCNNLWEHVDSENHQIMCIVIGTLFVLSLLEGILEAFFDWMPYNKLYKTRQES